MVWVNLMLSFYAFGVTMRSIVGQIMCFRRGRRIKVIRIDQIKQISKAVKSPWIQLYLSYESIL